MWSDGVSKVDMLAYEPYADLVYDIATSERLNPITIGLFGNWGSGKSTLLNLIENKINQSSSSEKVIPIMVNAWMFEGYDDAKTALMDGILRSINENESIGVKCKEGIGKLIKKIDWIRVGGSLAKKGIPLASSVMTGNPLPAILSSINTIKDFDFSKEEELNEIGDKISKLKKFIKDDDEKQSVVENIRTFRREFDNLLKESEVDNLIIMIDDLDRCTPDRILETLEAIKLFLAVDNTTFIIAMDEDVINYSIKRKYPQLSNDIGIDISKDYIEKIVQLPINLPELSEIDIENYILLLICEMLLSEEKLLELIEKLKKLELFIKGEPITVKDIYDSLELDNKNSEGAFKSGITKEKFEMQLEIFATISSIISSNLKGNPRQAKRFLNKFYVRKRLADIQNIKLDLAILAKLMVLEYTNIELFKKIYMWQFENEGFPIQLKHVEELVLSEEKGDEQGFSDWLKEDVKSWFFVEPTELSSKDLRQYFYLARESVSGKETTMLNIGVHERRKINEICKEGIDSTVRRRKIAEVKDLSTNEKREIIKGIISKYRQDNAKYIEILMYIFEELMEYREIVLKEIKAYKNKLTPSVIIHFKCIKNIQPKEYEEIRNIFINGKKVSEKLWDKILDEKERE